MSDSESASATVAYLEVTKPEYTAEAARTFTVDTYPEGILLNGTCPRCGAAMQIALLKEMFSRAILRRKHVPDGQPEPVQRVEPVICTCAEAHAGRPEGYVGCGAYWVFALADTAP
jgi:hypothetical protein